MVRRLVPDTGIIKNSRLQRVVVVCVALVNVHTWGLNAVSKQFADPILPEQRVTSVVFRRLSGPLSQLGPVR